MRHKPFIECFVGGKAVAPGFYDRLSTATVTDNAGQEADRIELVFDDSGNAIQMPEKGAKLSVSFGYKEFGSWVMGEFTVEKNRINFGPDGDKLTISGHSADMREDVKEQGSEHFDQTTIGDVVEQLAKRHGYDAKVSPELASKQIEYIARVGQSSLDFLTRLADRNRALFSIKGNKFLFLSRGILPTITIDKSECESGDFEVEPRTKFGKVEASYFDRATGKTETVSHSTGLKGPVRRLRTVYANKAEAEAAAGSEGDKLGRATGSGNLMMFGRPELMADTPLNLTGFRAEANGAWRAGTVTQTFAADSYKTGVAVEAPESGKE